jgi:phosphohistidine phosphatase SixA
MAMLKNTLFMVAVLLLTSCSHTYYVVRHAEKAVNAGGAAMMAGDPPLSEAGQRRAAALLDVLKDAGIHYIFSTNTLRTKSTAEPLRVYFRLITEIYAAKPDSAFITRLKGIKKNTLIVGHSNTVDDIVNGLCNAVKVPGDLNDSEYDNLFVIKYKRFFGTRISFERKKYGAVAQ